MGLCRPTGRGDEGLRLIRHAWLELPDGQVWDAPHTEWDSPGGRLWDKDRWPSEGTAQRYTLAQALEQISEHRHWGPWPP
jgi:hypothetical protein